MMSTYFSQVIKAGDRIREFNFRQMSSGPAVVYSVDVPDDKGNRITFTMHQSEEGKWQVSDPLLPAWINDAAPALNEAIQQNKNQHSFH